MIQSQIEDLFTGDNNWGIDVSCNLGSINIAKAMESKDLESAVRYAVNALNVVINETNIKSVPTVANGNNLIRSMGLGAMNLHGYYAKNRIFYEGEEAKDFADTFFMSMRFFAMKRSMEIARDMGIVFWQFEKSEYAKGEKGNFFPKYLENSFAPKTKKIQDLFEGMHIPTPEDWRWLMEQIQKFGLANGYFMAIAPTGSISYVQSATASISPITEQIETRTYGDSTTHYPMPYMNNDNMFFYTEAYDVDMFNYIDLVATIQQHVDQGISTTLFVDSNKTTEDLAMYFIYANKKGLKGLYYTRTKLLNSAEECESCSI